MSGTYYSITNLPYILQVWNPITEHKSEPRRYVQDLGSIISTPFERHLWSLVFKFSYGENNLNGDEAGFAFSCHLKQKSYSRVQTEMKKPKSHKSFRRLSVFYSPSRLSDELPSFGPLTNKNRGGPMDIESV